ncbi:hypothetical protein N781_00595 [Pontibacillus halophilus JSM 076056 = DSM 19796]|uniref:DUF4183 domain-containing protein n=1 Tax=Pontibacillus halophilus JSM 076056 = DSM 19796 TaxID=1385510 RepID=A0A0A5GQ33_9BACI|nr:DUF4183 domain-containing protein [Pontibacillus halophilus]KGX94054.1 hypothetical protein N781_00595 [Pontibacillus halophilus JSM 076056 = DSM 19796]
MALQIIKPYTSVSTSVEVTPDSEKFFYRTALLVIAGSTLTIDTDDFTRDDGTTATNLPALATNNSYYNVYINGVLQQEGLSTYTPGGVGVGSLAITLPGGGANILSGTPVNLEVVNFTPSANSVVSN